MAKQVKAKTIPSTMQGVNIKAVATTAAETITANNDTIILIRATAAEALLEVGRAVAETGDLEAVNVPAYWYGKAREEAGAAEGTVNKEKSQLRNIARACFGGIKVQKKLEENSTLYSHEFAALAKKLTPKAYAKKETSHEGR